MIQQDNVQTAWVLSPTLYGTYECEGHKSWRVSVSVSVYTYTCSWSLTQFECAQEKKWYEELETTRALVAPRDTGDSTNCICRSRQNY